LRVGIMRIVVDIPAGTSGDYEVAHYTNETTDNMWQVYLEMKNENYDNYTVLLKDGCPMPIMQDSEAEYNEHEWLWNYAEGHVVIGGLGIGMCHQALIDNPDVTSVTIVEISQDVIDLVWDDCVKDDTFSIVLGDFEEWTPPEGTEIDTVWADTWLVDNTLDINQYTNKIVENYSWYTNNIGFWGQDLE
tara:strand:+ start:155 stop:721 length:567 start_codon:yes stop_codon:yes gene_type:complete